MNLHGDIGLGRVNADVNLDFHDILEDLNVAVMLDMELRKGRFGIISDTVYAQLKDSGATTQDRLDIKATMDTLIQTVAATYRVGTWQLADFRGIGPLAVTVDPYAGARYTYLQLELDGRLDLPRLGVNAKRTDEGDQHWVDPLIGLRTGWTLGDSLSLSLSGDVGGTSTNEQWSAQGIAVLGYRFDLFASDNANLVGGYRVLRQKYKDGNGRSSFEWDVTWKGPVVGLTISF